MQLAIEGKKTKTHFPTRCISIWIFSPFFYYENGRCFPCEEKPISTLVVESIFSMVMCIRVAIFLSKMRKTILFLFSHVSLSMDSRSSINYAWNYIRDQIEIWFKYRIET